MTFEQFCDKIELIHDIPTYSIETLSDILFWLDKFNAEPPFDHVGKVMGSGVKHDGSMGYCMILDMGYEGEILQGNGIVLFPMNDFQKLVMLEFLKIIREEVKTRC